MRKFSLITYGCKLNQADSEIIYGILSEKFQPSSEDEADFVVINSCGVIEKTQRKIERKIQVLKKKHKKIILAGCLPLISEKIMKQVDGVIGPQNVLEIQEVVNQVFEGRKPVYLNKTPIDKAKLCSLKMRTPFTTTAIIPISEGCLGECAYCATKFARGKLYSFSQDSILKEIKMALLEGFKEIHLTSQDIACFGLDRGKYELPELLQKIIEIPGNFWVRIGMGNPQHFKKILNPLLSLYDSPKIYKYLHIPVQSGSDRVLKDMKRGYKTKDFLEIIEAFKKRFSDLMLVTDIIVGYPTETKDDFKKTVDLIKEVSPRIVNITKFSKREKTEASLLKDLPDRIKTERSRFLNRICLKIKEEDSKRFVGREEKVLVIRRGKNNTFLARPIHFRAIILKNAKIGKFLRVKIKKAKPNYLIGEIVQPNS